MTAVRGQAQGLQAGPEIVGQIQCLGQGRGARLFRVTGVRQRTQYRPGGGGADGQLTTAGAGSPADPVIAVVPGADDGRVADPARVFPRVAAGAHADRKVARRIQGQYVDRSPEPVGRRHRRDQLQRLAPVGRLARPAHRRDVVQRPRIQAVLP